MNGKAEKTIKTLEDIKFGHFPDINVRKAIIKTGRDWYKDMVGQEVEIVRFGTCGCYAKSDGYIVFYDLDFLD